MALEIKIPSPGESISEVELTSWFVEDGALVNKNQELGEIESEKATLPLIATEAGKVKILAKEGETLQVGAVVASIDTSVEVPDAPEESPADSSESEEAKEESEEAKEEEETPAAAKEARSGADQKTSDSGQKKDSDQKTSDSGGEKSDPDAEAASESRADHEAVKTTPVAKQIMEKEGLSVDDIISGLRKITASDVKQVMSVGTSPGIAQSQEEASREEERKKVSQLRKKISERLVAVKNETAMLTTFNEVDMSTIMAIRKQYQEQFVEKHGIKIGFMSFFTKAVTEALKQFPLVNSYLDGAEVVSPKYSDVGIAVQTEKGLMVPVIRNAETLSLADIEKRIADLAKRARQARLSIEEMSGGTFTISNGGIYGSMLSTPILNPPQSAILGMHNILERPVAIQGKVEIRPMMYLALSYDHRIIDGKDSVSFLLAVKEFLEQPARLIFGKQSPEQFLLGI